jgi:hypothetical protein
LPSAKMGQSANRWAGSFPHAGKFGWQKKSNVCRVSVRGHSANLARRHGAVQSNHPTPHSGSVFDGSGHHHLYTNRTNRSFRETSPRPSTPKHSRRRLPLLAAIEIGAASHPTRSAL